MKKKEHLLFLVETLELVTKMSEENCRKVYGKTKAECLENVMETLKKEIVNA